MAPNSAGEGLVRAKTGNEPLHTAGQCLDKTLLDFWKWSSSDVLGNALRGKLAEYIVAVDLRCDSGVRQEWDAYDLITEDGVKIEVKSSSYLQSWDQDGLSKIKFGIQPTYGWDATKDTVSEERMRQADVYIFCVLANQDEKTIDPLDMEQWEFYVISTKVLDEELGGQKSITLSSLLCLEPIQCKFGKLSDSVSEALQ